MLCSKPGEATPSRGLETLSKGIRDILASADIVFGNLECTLSGPETIQTEPRLISTEQQVRSVKAAGIHAVSLGNNHMFDCMDAGFQRTADLLDELQIPWCGAGRDLSQALEPAIVAANGVRLAFLGVVDATTGISRFAGHSTSGVTPLDTEMICRRIRDLKHQVDHVIVSPHWGTERFRFPSPDQIEQAHAFIDAGASMVLGHHPHVMQGMEQYQGKPIIYSLGNFFSNTVYFSDKDEELIWSRFERTGCILTAELESAEIITFSQIPTFDDGRTVEVEKSGQGARYIEKANRLLERGVTAKRYERERFRVQIVKPILNHLRWSQLHKLRPRHIINGIKLFFK